MTQIVIIETVVLIGLFGSWLGLKAKVKGLEMLLSTYELIAKSRENLEFYARYLHGETK